MAQHRHYTNTANIAFLTETLRVDNVIVFGSTCDPTIYNKNLPTPQGVDFAAAPGDVVYSSVADQTVPEAELAGAANCAGVAPSVEQD